MHIMRTAGALLLASSLICNSAVTFAGPAEDLVAKMAQPGGQIVNTFETEVGLKGFVVQHQQTKKTAIIYVDPEGKFLLSGLLFDGQGNNLTSAQYDTLVPKPDQTALLKDAEKAAWIEDGKPDAKAVIYALGEPHCGYCKLFYQQTRAAVTKGDLAIRWIMIGFDPAGKQSAASLFTASDKAKSLYDTFARDQSGRALTPFVPMTVAMSPRPPGEAPAAAVARNEAFAVANNMGGTPYIVYRTASGSVEALPGAPQPGQLADILKVAAR